MNNNFCKTQKLKKFYNIVITIIIIFFGVMFFTKDFGFIGINNTTIILSVGIDKKTDNQIEMSILIADSDTENELTATSYFFSAHTVAQALNNFTLQTGLSPKYSFCNSIIFGTTILEDSIEDILSFFTKKMQFNDNANLFATPNAKQLFETENIKDLSQSLIQVTNINNRNINNAVSINLKDFAKNQLSVCPFNFIPFVELSSNYESKEQNDSANEQPTSSTKKQTLSLKSLSLTEQQTKNNKAQIKINGTALVLNDKMQTLLDNELSIALCYFHFPNKKGVIQTSKTPFEVLSLHKNENLTFENDKINFTLNLKFIIKELNPAFDEHSKITYDETKKQEFEDFIVKTFNNLFETARENNCDVFRITQNFYKFHYKDFQKLTDSQQQSIIKLTNFKIVANVD